MSFLTLDLLDSHKMIQHKITSLSSLSHGQVFTLFLLVAFLGKLHTTLTGYLDKVVCGGDVC